MNIGVTTFGGDGEKSGISRYIIQLLREFHAHPGDAQFDVLTHADERDIFVPGNGCMRSITAADMWRNPVANIAWHQLALPRRCQSYHFDVLFLPAGNRRLPITAPCPVVGTIHDFSSFHVAGKYSAARTFYIKKVLPMLIRRLSRVLTVSESSKADIIEFANVPEEKIIVTPLAADSKTFFPRDKEQSAEFVFRKYGVRAPYVLFTSRIEHAGKNHVRLIRAFDRLKTAENLPHQLVLAGSDWTRADEVHRVAAAATHAADIIFTGFVPGHELPDLYCGADLFVFPSLYEGFGLPPLEAMSCGVPVACSEVSSLPEVCGNAAVYFDPYAEDDIAEAMRQILTDSAVRKRCTRDGLQRSREFSWSRTAEKTLEVLREVAKERC